MPPKDYHPHPGYMVNIETVLHLIAKYADREWGEPDEPRLAESVDIVLIQDV